MRTHDHWILNVIHSAGAAETPKTILDLGGGRGIFRQPIEERGDCYVNLDVERRTDQEPSLIGDAHRLPFADGIFDFVISKDTLEHFVDPWSAVQEVRRVLKEGGHFLIWVPFLHPFHGDDYYRYSPLGLRHLLRDFQIVTFDSPQWIFTVVGLAAVEAFSRLRLRFLARPIKATCRWLDHMCTRHHPVPRSYAGAYRLVARSSSPAPSAMP
jgi:SAM-dependent methyltransferase